MQIFYIIFLAVATQSLVYLPQPLTPLLAQYFGTSNQIATLVVSLTLLPMAVAPIIYGYLLELFSAKKIIIISSISCAILQILSTLSDSISTFLILKIVQSVFFPAILTTLLTTLTRLSNDNIQRNISYYVSSTISGGLIGRVAGSFFSDLFGWQVCFNIFAVLMILAGICFMRTTDSTSHNKTNAIKLSAFAPFLSNKRIMQVLLSVFCMFFVFQSILTILPFWLKQLNGNISESSIGLFYISYLIGIIVSIFTPNATRFLKSKVNLIIAGFCIFGLGTAFLSISNMAVIFVGMFVVCAGCFTCHNVLSALLNAMSEHQKGITNGLYLSFYYTGGVIGSYVPMFCFEYAGWKVLCALLCLLLFTNAYLFWRSKWYFGRF